MKYINATTTTIIIKTTITRTTTRVETRMNTKAKKNNNF